MFLKNKILKAINEGINKSLINFNDQEDTIHFNKSKNTLDKAYSNGLDKLYGFKNCSLGDKVFYDKALGINLISGEEIGECVILPEQNNGVPKFLFKDIYSLYDVFGDRESISLDRIKHMIKEITNIYDHNVNQKIKFYLPHKKDLVTMYKNGLYLSGSCITSAWEDKTNPIWIWTVNRTNDGIGVGQITNVKFFSKQLNICIFFTIKQIN